MINEAEFSRIYRQAVGELMACMPDDWGPMARHNVGWVKGNFDARQYLLDSETRFLRTYRVFAEKQCKKLLDVGGFLAAFPLTMKRLGFDVSVTENFTMVVPWILLQPILLEMIFRLSTVILHLKMKSKNGSLAVLTVLVVWLSPNI